MPTTRIEISLMPSNPRMIQQPRSMAHRPSTAPAHRREARPSEPNKDFGVCADCSSPRFSFSSIEELLKGPAKGRGARPFSAAARTVDAGSMQHHAPSTLVPVQAVAGATREPFLELLNQGGETLLTRMVKVARLENAIPVEEGAAHPHVEGDALARAPSQAPLSSHSASTEPAACQGGGGKGGAALGRDTPPSGPYFAPCFKPAPVGSLSPPKQIVHTPIGSRAVFAPAPRAPRREPRAAVPPGSAGAMGGAAPAGSSGSKMLTIISLESEASKRAKTLLATIG